MIKRIAIKPARASQFGGGPHGMIREQAIEKIQLIVDEFEGLYISL